MDWAFSDSDPVLSGVSQGTVLGRILFCIYINDLPGGAVNSTVRLFTDDTVLFTAPSRTKNTLIYFSLTSILSAPGKILGLCTSTQTSVLHRISKGKK